MKRFRIVLSMILALSMLMSSALVSYAEAQDAPLQVDIRSLMDEAFIPRVTNVLYDHNIPAEAQSETHSFRVERVNSSGMTMAIEFEMIAVEDFTDDAWTAIDAWLERTSDSAIQGVGADTEAMADAVSKAIENSRKAAATGPDAAISPWASNSLKIQKIGVSIPYYRELSVDVNGAATEKLQQKLIQLGYLDDTADGYYGAKTAQAVEQLENHIRALEQDVIDAMPAPAVTPAPEATMAVPEDILLDVSAEATPMPGPTPATPADGIADALLQAYLYSDDFVVARDDLKYGDQGDAVLRLQRRLARLGCMFGAADGIYGGDTARAVRIFQYYNGLEQTGEADIALQKLLFSEEAKKPEKPMMAAGATGEGVKELQLRLRVLGFMDSSVDGDYGAGTTRGVKNLQQYMRDKEEIAIRADAEVMALLESTGEDISSMLTVEVNGIADPILLDDFFSVDFPAMPTGMQSGSNGPDVVRLQRRLNTLEYYYGMLDGDFGAGTASALKTFQKRHGLEQTGEANMATMEVLFSENALKALKPYVLKVSTKDQRVYAYGLDNNNEHTVLVRTMKCSTGKNETPTPKGTFQGSTGPGARWHYFKKFDCWAQYAYYIQGDIMFHSVLYNEKGGPVTQSSVNNLGRKASHGCVRLSVEDAKWLYNNCPMNTKIIVY